jgi:AcrR family transcriptional regulator
MGKRPYRQDARARAADRTRAAILDAAARRFSAEPYDAVSLEQIATRAGVTVQSVLRIFGSKGGLFEAAAARSVAQLGSAGGATADDDPRVAIARTCAIYERWGDATHRVMAQEDRVPAIRRVAEQGRARHRRWVEGLFARRLAGRGRARRLAVLVALLELASYRRLRAQGLRPQAARDALYEAAMALVRPARS